MRRRTFFYRSLGCGCEVSITFGESYLYAVEVLAQLTDSNWSWQSQISLVASASLTWFDTCQRGLHEIFNAFNATRNGKGSKPKAQQWVDNAAARSRHVERECEHFVKSFDLFQARRNVVECYGKRSRAFKFSLPCKKKVLLTAICIRKDPSARVLSNLDKIAQGKKLSKVREDKKKMRNCSTIVFMLSCWRFSLARRGNCRGGMKWGSGTCADLRQGECVGYVTVKLSDNLLSFLLIKA